MKKAVLLLVALFWVAGMLTSALAITRGEAEKNVADTRKVLADATKLYSEKEAAYRAVYKVINARKGLDNANDPKVKQAALEKANAAAAKNKAQEAYDKAVKELNNILNPPPPQQVSKGVRMTK
jgi:hypothetical protein